MRFLFACYTLPALQALLGFEHKLEHLDGHVVTLKREGVTQPGNSQLSAFWKPPVTL
jgi:hypothetical protein